MKKLLFYILFLSIFAACKNEPGQAIGDPEVTAADANPASALEDIRSKAIPEEDRFARAENALVTLQNEYRKADGKVPGVGKVTVFLDKHFTMIIKNEIGDDVFESKVSLMHLDPNEGGMQLLPDMTADEYPGLKINVLSGRKGVEITKNGEFVSEERELIIYMPERTNIEQLTPAMASALNVVHKKS